jgi:hypothetical protein
MLIALIALAFRRQHTLPTPITIAAALSLLGGSSIPARFGDLAMTGEKERNKKIEELELRNRIGGVRDDNGHKS